jgi:hypothetical protein
VFIVYEVDGMDVCVDKWVGVLGCVCVLWVCVGMEGDRSDRSNDRSIQHVHTQNTQTNEKNETRWLEQWTVGYSAVIFAWMTVLSAQANVRVYVCVYVYIYICVCVCMYLCVCKYCKYILGG